MAVAAAAAKKRGKKKARKRKVVPFYDRAAIDDGALAGRNLEICWLKDPIDSFFIHIQGSVRVRLEDGKLLRLNYDAAQRPSLLRGRHVPDRAQHHLARKRCRWTASAIGWSATRTEGKELRRRNKSYVFFRETSLASNEEPTGAQGVSLTPGRSIAVDRNLHVYGTPFFISAHAADRERAADDAVPPADDRAGHRRRDRRAGARRHLFRRRRRGRQRRRAGCATTAGS